MFYRIAVKWLSITVIVIAVFLVILLFLGYLLKENEAITTKLKNKLAQEAQQQQAKDEGKLNPFLTSKAPLTAAEKSQQSIIANNQYCDTAKHCFLVHTHSLAMGCIVSVNTTGAAILLKISAKNNKQQLLNDGCRQEYEQQQSLTAQCLQKRCRY